jgi:hypothetical protein
MGKGADYGAIQVNQGWSSAEFGVRSGGRLWESVPVSASRMRDGTSRGPGEVL